MLNFVITNRSEVVGDMDLSLPLAEELSKNQSEISNKVESEKKRACIYSLAILEVEAIW